MRPYSEIKAIFIDSWLQHATAAGSAEMEAIITHWLHTPPQQVPLCSHSMHNLFCKLLHDCDGSVVKESHSWYQPRLLIDWSRIPFPPVTSPRFTFIDLFAGIGGFRIPLQQLGGKCVFSCECNPDARRTYEANFGEVPYGNIRQIDADTIPEHDLLCAGFPCQPFSAAGVSARKSRHMAHGFQCKSEGTLFFELLRIVEAKRPSVLFLENVKNLVYHNNKSTFQIIRKSLEAIGYSFNYRVLDSSSLVPQRRVRCYIVCFRDKTFSFEFPDLSGPSLPLHSVLDANVDSRYTISSKLWEGHKRRTKNNLCRGAGFTAFCADLSKPSNTIVSRYGKDGKECLIPQAQKNPRLLTPRECARLQGFPESFVLPEANTVAYRLLGNSVAVPVVRRIAENIVQAMGREAGECC